MAIKVSKKLMDSVVDKFKKEYNATIISETENRIEMSVNLSAICIKAKPVKVRGTKYVEIAISFEANGETIYEIPPYRISGDGTYTIQCSDGFTAQQTIYINNF